MKTVCVRFTQNVLLNWLIGHTFANIYRLWISQMQTAQKKRSHFVSQRVSINGEISSTWTAYQLWFHTFMYVSIYIAVFVQYTANTLSVENARTAS